MATSADRSEGARTLPRPELNPLLNPLLAENMGRWAEVYFTSAPEKREEAVLELLRDLETRKSQNVLLESPAAPPTQLEMPAGTVDGGQGDLRLCQRCGHDNPAKNQFCGMCGSQLGERAPEPPSETKSSDNDGAEKKLAEDPALRPGETEDLALRQGEADVREPIHEEMVASPVEPRDNPYDLTLLQSLRAKEPETPFDYGQFLTGRYRYAIGAALAILMLGLGYLTWRGAHHASQSAQATPPPPPTESAVPATSPSPASRPAPPPHAVQSQSAPARTNASRPIAPKSAEIPKPVKATTAVEHTPASIAAPPPPGASNNGRQSSTGNGADEYAKAERYLHSQPRDSAEAAKWLWKAIGKHNGPAALALADLYLKGDGVTKSCDQARVLLDSAARRDMARAADRLRNLRDFGCQ